MNASANAPHPIVADDRLRDSSKIIYQRIEPYARGGMIELGVQPGWTQITGKTKATIEKAQRELVATGWLRRFEPLSGNKPVRFQLTAPAGTDTDRGGPGFWAA